MDARTVAVYEREATRFAERRRASSVDRAESFAAAVAPGGRRVDLGSGLGHHVPFLGTPVVAADAAPAMLLEARRRHGPVAAVACDLEHLALRPGSLAGVWASKCLQHIPAARLPLALAGLHRVLALGGILDLTVFRGEGEDRCGADDDLPGRLFAAWQPGDLADVLVGAGFTVDDIAVSPQPVGRDVVSARATRARSLPDTVGPGMRLLVCGLNPSLYAADAGVGFARPGNRFWPAAREAGIVTSDRSPDRALVDHGVGMTDVVKRATAAAAELSSDEYRTGLARVERLARWLRPGAVCFVGLAGWRAAVDRRAVPGAQPRRLGGVPVYVMPSTSGLNARVPLAELTDHLRAAAGLAEGGGPVV